jgi:hypothetical protein
LVGSSLTGRLHKYPYLTLFINGMLLDVSVYQNWPPQYSWNIVESVVKHDQTSKQTNTSVRANLSLGFTDRLLSFILNAFCSRFVMAVPFILPTSLLRRVSKKEIFFIRILFQATHHGNLLRQLFWSFDKCSYLY